MVFMVTKLCSVTLKDLDSYSTANVADRWSAIVDAAKVCKVLTCEVCCLARFPKLFHHPDEVADFWASFHVLRWWDRSAEPFLCVKHLCAFVLREVRVHFLQALDLILQGNFGHFAACGCQ